MNPAPLDVFFRPRSVALVGATEKPDSVGRAIFANLQATPFGGPLYAVNPKHERVLGARCYPNIAAIPGPVDLAVIVIPAACVPDVVRECVQAGVRGAVIISAGFRETGPSGVALEQEAVAIARAGGIRLVGPNCVGVMNPHSGLNATFAASMAQPGHVGLISQSGAVCTAILDWSQQEKVGFSAFVSTGSMVDVEWGDLIAYLGDDPNTRSILVYMESVPDAGKFVAAARKVAPQKPIIVLKPGRTEAAARAAASHTGALTGRDDVLDAAFQRCGILRVDTIAELFNMAEALAKQPHPRGPKLIMVTNAGGAGVLAADALLTAGGELPELAAETVTKLNAVLPPSWSHHNPIDILGDAGPDRYAQAIAIAAQDPSADGLLIALAPQAMTDPTEVARAVVKFTSPAGVPVLASWMGGVAITAGEAILNQAGIPTYRYPDAAARVFHSMWRRSSSVQLLDEPHPLRDSTATHSLIANARQTGRTLLTETESKVLLADYGIPTVPTEVAHTEEDAISAAARFGYPVAIKLHSESITHKSDVGGVRLNVRDALEVRASFQAVRSAVPAADFLGVSVQPMVRTEGLELILGASADPQFGPVLLFGAGGILVEVYKDRAIGLPPLTPALARRMIEQTKIFAALKGIRGRKPIAIDALADTLVRLSRMVTEQPWLREIDINPLLASPERLVALDARVILYPPGAPEPVLPALLRY